MNKTWNKIKSNHSRLQTQFPIPTILERVSARVQNRKNCRRKVIKSKESTTSSAIRLRNLYYFSAHYWLRLQFYCIFTIHLDRLSSIWSGVEMRQKQSAECSFTVLRHIHFSWAAIQLYSIENMKINAAQTVHTMAAACRWWPCSS